MGSGADPRRARASSRERRPEAERRVHAHPPGRDRKADLAANRRHARAAAQRGRDGADCARHGVAMGFLKITIDLEPTIFQIGPFLVTWHGVFAVLGIIAAARLGLWLLSKDGVDTSHGYDGVAWMVVLGLIGARLLYVWENFQLFSGQLLRIFALTEGGISQWGGLFGAIVGAYVWARRSQVSFGKVMDAAGPAALAGLAIGRIGDIINGEHHGTPTNLPWAVDYVNAHTLGQPGLPVHPEVAYEMILCGLIVAALLPFHFRLMRRLPPGVLGLIYLGVYAFGRFL